MKDQYCPQCKSSHPYVDFITPRKDIGDFRHKLCRFCRRENELRQRAREKESAKKKRAERRRQEIEDGIRFICKKCGRAHLVTRMSSTHEGVCLSCVSLIIRSDTERKSYESRLQDIKTIKEHDSKLTSEQKAKRQEDERQMVERFLKDKETR